MQSLYAWEKSLICGTLVLNVMWEIMAQVALDDKYRIVLDKKTREIAGLRKGDRLVAIPFTGGVILVSPRHGKFAGSLTSFGFSEQRHEASRYLFRRKP